MAHLWVASLRTAVRQNVARIKVKNARWVSHEEAKTELPADESEEKCQYNVEAKSPDPENHFKFTCGKYAGFADGCAVVESGGTAVMATAVASGQPSSYDLTPVTVNYIQKAAALGRIPANFLKRELAPTDHEIITSRLIDRSIRPLFSPHNTAETQIICRPLAMDGSNFPEVLAINAASAALAVSDIPWGGPVAATRVGLIDSTPVLNPTKLELKQSSVNMVVTTVGKNMILMLEASFDNVSPNEVNLCLKEGMKHCRAVMKKIEALRSAHGRKKRSYTDLSLDPELVERVKKEASEKLSAILIYYDFDKMTRDKVLREVRDECIRSLGIGPDQVAAFDSAFKTNLRQLYKSLVQSTGRRCDGRRAGEIRQITCDVGLYEALHGSSVFKRGQTQVFCTVALDSPGAAVKLDRVTAITSGVMKKNFFVHYTFPPFATGEVGKTMRTRREVGHGNLAEKALMPAMPSMPFTVNLSAEVFESNGSSSMATVCGGTMALLDAGIELRYPVVGVAMGLLSKDGSANEGVILTDILGMEDYLGDMDFKVAGTKTGFTAMQMDLKIPGITFSLLSQAMINARKAFEKIFKCMEIVISEPRVRSKANWPVAKIVTMPIHVRQKFIGVGGSNLKTLEADVGVEVTEVEPGKFSIFAPSELAMTEALDMIDELMEKQKEVELIFGSVYNATVVEVTDGGCFIRVHDDMKPAFIPMSQLHVRRAHHPEVLNIGVGTEFQVKYFGRDPTTGAMRFSRKVLMDSSWENDS